MPVPQTVANQTAFGNASDADSDSSGCIIGGGHNAGLIAMLALAGGFGLIRRR